MLRKMGLHDIDQVAKIHQAELSGLLSELGEMFLKKFYKTSLSVPEMFTIVEAKNGQILGFATATVSMKGLYKKIILKDIPGFGISLLKYFSTHPSGIFQTVKIFTYPGFTDDIPELLTIAVAKKWQKRGIGRKLFQEIVREFKKRKITSFRVSAYGRLLANEFYQKIGCSLERSFDFMSEKMNYYRYGNG